MKGETYTRYAPCQMCEGTGERGKWVSLPDFLEMLKAAQCKHEHTSYGGGMHFSAGDVWDDIMEVCDDCDAKLDRQTLGTLSRMTTNPIHSPKSVFLWRGGAHFISQKGEPQRSP